MKNIVFVLGGDGFCGWPTALHLSANGYDVVIVDNLVRRQIDTELGTESLTPIVSIEERIGAWHEVSGKEIKFHNIDIAKEYDAFFQLLLDYMPESIVHFAEQRAAPYSMKSAKHKRYTVDNNVNATHNTLVSIVESGLDIHLVHLGTMGIYGYGAIPLKTPEGYLEVSVSNGGRPFNVEIPYPAAPGSVYHASKELDAALFRYYARNDKLRITDLHQGIVWGANTEETNQDLRLINRFDYDGDFGTVLNRFLVQSAIGHPLTVYGIGGQARAFINIQNSVECIRLALSNPPNHGDRVCVINQMTEVYTVKELAELIAQFDGAKIEFIENPRLEAAENTLEVANDILLEYGLKPKKLSETLLEDILTVAKRYAGRARPDVIYPFSLWHDTASNPSQSRKN
tara:strand:- start:20819 stop:22018 length:1200 start_codon:yes stop_codon:yes gene_type:complete